MLNYPLQGYVVQVNGAHVLINLGSNQGVVQGTHFDIIEEQPPIEFKGKVLKAAAKPIAQLEVYKVENDFSYAMLSNQRRPIKSEDKIIEKIDDMISMGDRSCSSVEKLTPLFCWRLFWLPCAAQHSRLPENEKIVAVWSPDDLSFQSSPWPDLGELLGSQVTAYIGESGKYAVVEREKLDAVLEELNLATSALADPATRLKIGRLAGARMMVFGGYQVVGSSMRLDLRLVDVATAGIVATATETVDAADLNAWLRAASARGGSPFRS